MPEQNVTLKSHPEKNKIHLPKNEVKTSLSIFWWITMEIFIITENMRN